MLWCTVFATLFHLCNAVLLILGFILNAVLLTIDSSNMDHWQEGCYIAVFRHGFLVLSLLSLFLFLQELTYYFIFNLPYTSSCNSPTKNHNMLFYIFFIFFAGLIPNLWIFSNNTSYSALRCPRFGHWLIHNLIFTSSQMFVMYERHMHRLLFRFF